LNIPEDLPIDPIIICKWDSEEKIDMVVEAMVVALLIEGQQVIVLFM